MNATLAAPLILLAPMEGVMDWVLRDVLSQVGGMNRAVSEFIRITQSVLPVTTYHRYMPELLRGSTTCSGLPVRGQLLGSDPHYLAANAVRLAQLGAEGIDLNFGCPAKTVNRHRGGAALLTEPDLLHHIMQTVRAAVPANIPVSAKMRLGLNDDSLAVDCAMALVSGGASELVIHARTKLDGYSPPAYWHRIAPIAEAINAMPEVKALGLSSPYPIIANGEIWTVQDALQARRESTCSHLMLGRGVVANPFLPLQLRAHDAGLPLPEVEWHQLHALLIDFWQTAKTQYLPHQTAGRLKQWLNYMRKHLPQAQALYEQVRPLQDGNTIEAILYNSHSLSKIHEQKV